MFFVIFAAILLLDVLFWWWADRRARRLPRARVWRTAVALFVGLQLLYLALMMLVPGFRRASHHVVPSWALATMYLWHLLVLPTWLVVAGGFELTRIAAAGARLFRRVDPADAPDELPSVPPSAAPAWSRRQVLAAAALAVAPAAAIGLTGIGVSQLRDLRVRDLDVPIPGLPPALNGLRIAHVTDVHVGRYTRGGQLQRIADATNKLSADLVLLTGDLIDQSILDLPEALDFVAQLDPRAGLFTCEGNHDLIDDPIAFRARTKAAGVPLFVQEALTIDVRGEPVQLLGLGWGRREQAIRAGVEALLRQRDSAAFPILLAHHPHAFDYAAAADVPLTLAGHTHGGQLMLNERLGAGPVMFRYWSGLYARAASRLVVSNGAGNWFPLRTASPAEIVHITLRQASA